MTITLHWWLLPALLVLAGCGCFMWARFDRSWAGGLIEMMIGVTCWAAALFVCIGYWIGGSK